MKRFAIGVVSLMLTIMLIVPALAGGLLPSIGDAFGKDLPTIRKILLRDPDATETLADGSKTVTFYGVTETEFDQFSTYLGEFGCTLAGYSVEGTVMTASVEKNGHTFTFTYDYEDGTAVLSYPPDTNEESFDVAAAAAAARESFTQVGNIVTYGHYEQDNNTSNGKEAIEWIVLDYDSITGRSLLLTRHGLDAHRFDVSEYQGWDKSEIRTWLNSMFLNVAFTSEEQLGIATTTIKTGNNAEWDAYIKQIGFPYIPVDGGADTQDKIFLLSLEEAMEYGGYSTSADCTDKMKATPTKYAVAQGANQYSDTNSKSMLNGTGCCWWWLRSPGIISSFASFVGVNGSLSSLSVDWADGCIRPAFWLNLDSAAIY